MSQYNLDRIFRLCRVVVGASEKARSIGNPLMKNLTRLGGNRA